MPDWVPAAAGCPYLAKERKRRRRRRRQTKREGKKNRKSEGERLANEWISEDRREQGKKIKVEGGRVLREEEAMKGSGRAEERSEGMTERTKEGNRSIEGDGRRERERGKSEGRTSKKKRIIYEYELGIKN